MVKDTDAIRQKTWRYGRLIEQAHKQGKSAEEFARLVNKSIASAMQKLGAAPKDTSTAIDLGRQHASQLFANQSVLRVSALGANGVLYMLMIETA